MLKNLMPLPDSVGRCFPTLKSTPFRFAWLLMTVVAGIGLASCKPSDTIHFTSSLHQHTPNPYKGVYGALIDGIKDENFLNDHIPQPADSDKDMYIGNFTGPSVPGDIHPPFRPSERGEIIAFGPMHPPTILKVNWTPSSNHINLAFQKEYRFQVYAWIVSGNPSNQRENANLAAARTMSIWYTQSQGFRIISFPVDDTKQDQVAFRNFSCDSFNDPNQDHWITTNRMQANVINIYYVNAVQGPDGYYSRTIGVNCGAAIDRKYTNVIVLGSETSPGLLAHELGHSFGLDHVTFYPEFDDTNVMHEQSDRRRFFTEGQTFRQATHTYSAIYNIYKDALQSDGITLPTPRDCPDFIEHAGEAGSYSTERDKLTIRDCPRLQERIWPDE